MPSLDIKTNRFTELKNLHSLMTYSTPNLAAISFPLHTWSFRTSVLKYWKVMVRASSEIMALFVLSKFILQTRMHCHPMGLDVWFLVGPFVYFHTSCMQTAKALARLRGCAGSPEPSLVAYAISTIISWAGSYWKVMMIRCFEHRSLKFCPSIIIIP